MTPKQLSITLSVELVAVYVLVGVVHATHNQTALLTAVGLLIVIGFQSVFDVARSITREVRARREETP